MHFLFLSDMVRPFRAPACILIATLLALTVPAYADDPNFSGKWHLNEDRSEIHRLPHPPALVLEIKHEGSLVQCLGKAKPAAEPEECSFTTDGKEYKAGKAPLIRRSMAKWEGSALLLNTIVVNQHSQHTEMDRWKLMREGKALVVRRQIVGPRGESESTLYYEIQD